MVKQNFCKHRFRPINYGFNGFTLREKQSGEIIGTMLSLRFVLKMFGDEFVHRILNDLLGVYDGRHQNPFLTRRFQKPPQYNFAA